MMIGAPSEVKRRPIRDVENEEDDGEGDEHGHVQLAGLVLGQWRGQLSERFHLSNNTVMLPVNKNYINKQITNI